MANSEVRRGNPEGGVITKKEKGWLIEGAGVVVTAAALFNASLLAAVGGLVIFEAGRRYKKDKK